MQTAIPMSDDGEALRCTVQELTFFSTLSAVWIHSQPAGIAESLAEVLFRALAVEFVFVRATGAAGFEQFETVRPNPGPSSSFDAEAIGRMLEPLCDPAAFDQPPVIPNPAGEGTVRLAFVPLGCEGDYGFLVAGSRQPGFPGPTDRLLLGVAGSQAAVVLQQKRTEEALRAAKAEAESRAKEAEEARRILQTIFDNIPEGIVLVGGPPDYPILANSRYGQEVLNRSLDAGVGLSSGYHAEAYGLFLPDGITRPGPDELPLYRASRYGERVSNVELLMERSDGSRIPILVDASPIRDTGGNVVGAVNCWRDISERKQAEEAERRHAEEVEKLMEVMPVAVWIARDPGCKQITGNRAGHRLLRVPPGHNLSKTAPPEELPAGFKIYHAGREVPPEELPMQYAATHGIEIRDYEEDIVYADGTVVHAFGSALPLFDDQGSVRGSIAAFMDVSELRRLETELRENMEALAVVDRRKDEFLATLAHELRNPLAPLRNAVELLRSAGGSSGRIEQVSRILERQLGQMVRLVDDLLDISRIAQGRLRLRREPVELKEVVQSAVETARPLIEASGHELTVSVPPEPTFLDADPTRLAQVFANLLNNASRYTERSGRIWFTAERQGSETRVSVRDTGIGIAAEHLPRLFEIFSQAAPALERSHGGLGVGLSLVKGLVDLHGGRVEARSAGPGSGSEFIVHLPIIEAPAGASRLPDEGEESRGGPRLRILVVDDNRDAADTLALVLETFGHETETAYDGLKAVQSAGSFRPAVVLLDIGLPGLNGYDAARQIRQRPWGKDMALIALTGWGQEEDRRRALAAGFDHHLTKPVEPTALARLLSELPPSRESEAGGGSTSRRIGAAATSVGADDSVSVRTVQ